MGYHTYCYKKVQPSEEEVIALAKQAMQKVVENCKSDFVKQYYTTDQLGEVLKYSQRTLTWLEKGWIRRSAVRLTHYHDIEGSIYESVQTRPFHVILFGEDEVLKSYDECTKFLEGMKGSITWYNEDSLKNFWKLHPDGIIIVEGRVKR